MQPPGSERVNGSTGSGCLSDTVVAASKTVWVKHRLSKGQGRVLRKERSRGSKHREFCIFPVLLVDGTVWSVLQLLCNYNRAAQPLPQHNAPSHDSGILSTWLLSLHGRRGISPAQGKDRYVSSELIYMGLFALGEGLKSLEIYWSVLQTVS